MQMVKAINQALEGETVGRAIAARQIGSGDILISTASNEHKKELESNVQWLKALDNNASVVPPVFRVLAHGMRPSVSISVDSHGT